MKVRKKAHSPRALLKFWAMPMLHWIAVPMRVTCGLRIVSADHPGGVELCELFPEDVRIVPREQIEPLAKVIRTELERAARSSEATRARIEKELRPATAIRAYLDLYEACLA